MTRRIVLALGLVAAGCASNGPELEFGLKVKLPSVELPAASAQTVEGPAPPEESIAPPDEDELDRAIRDYDAEALERIVETEYERLEREKEAAVADLRRFSRAALHLAEIRKFEATVATSAEERRLAIERRLSVARRGSAVAKTGLDRVPDDPELLYYHGEHLAYQIDGMVSGLRYGQKARDACEKAVARGAGPGAELALARRFYYLPAVSGGDLDQAVRELEAILGRHPDFEPAWGFLGEVRQARGERDQAAAACRKAVELDPKSLRGRFFLDHPEAEPRP